MLFIVYDCIVIIKYYIVNVCYIFINVYTLYIYILFYPNKVKILPF